MVVIVLAIVTTYWLAGLYGVGIAAMAMLSLAGIVVSIDAYGPITDNAGGIAEMAELGDEVRNVTDPLDAFGNTTKAVTKGYAIASAGLAAVALFATYIEDLKRLGGIEGLRFDLSGSAGAGRSLHRGHDPLRIRLLRHERGERGGHQRRGGGAPPGSARFRASWRAPAQPDYRTCVDIVTQAALRLMIAPALIPALIPILVGLTMGSEALGGLLIGSIVSGVCVALSMTTGGAAWDNAKKYIEAGEYGGKGSEAHQGRRHRRHRGRPLQGHGRPRHQPDAQAGERGGAADHPLPVIPGGGVG